MEKDKINDLFGYYEFNDHLNKAHDLINKNPFKSFGQEIEPITWILDGISFNSYDLTKDYVSKEIFKLSKNKKIIGFFLYSRYTVLLDSVIKTLKNIHMLLPLNSFGDVMTLLRRYEEGLLNFIFFISLENNYNKYKNIYEEKIKNWQDDEEKWFLSFKAIKKFIIDNKILNNIFSLLKINFDELMSNRKYLTSFIHYSGLEFMNHDIKFDDLQKQVNLIEEEIKLFTKIFIIFCVTNCDWYCRSDDYDYINYDKCKKFYIMPVLSEYIINNFNKQEIDYIINNSNIILD